jgi:hypothetical protein
MTMFKALDPAVLGELQGVDDAGRPMRPFVDDEGGAPLRCCLRRSEPGERIALVTYAPLRRWAARAGVDPGAYDEQGPIYIHAGACGGPAEAGYPLAIHGERRVFRAYGADGHIRGGRLIEADADVADKAARAAIDELWNDSDVAVVHARAVEFGCFLFEVQRGS